MDVSFSAFSPKGIADAPASKSAGHRMLILAALSDGVSEIRMKSKNEDIDATVRCLRQLGATITRTDSGWSVNPISAQPASALLDCRESGSTLRFLVPVAAALGVNATFTGRGRLPFRPMDPLKEALKKNGIRVNGEFPLEISGKLQSGNFTLPGNVSSQFFTGLMLALTRTSEKSVVQVTPPVESASYMRLTLETLRRFGVSVDENNDTYAITPTVPKSGVYTVEGDWSNAAALLCLGAAVRGLHKNSAQGDCKVLSVLQAFGAEIHTENDVVQAKLSALHGINFDASDIPDLVPVLAAVAATAKGTTHIHGAARLRLKESDRIESTCALINTLGGFAQATDDGIIIHGKTELAGGTVSSFCDHRIVMAAAVLAQNCKAPVIVKDAQAINKSYPTFFETLKSIGGALHVL